MALRRVRRNDPCPCGSGKRFKHCHGAEDRLPSWVPKRIEAMETQRRAQQGRGRPIVSWAAGGSRFITVGQKTYSGRYGTFHDFLLWYVREKMGREWIAGSAREIGHPILEWIDAHDKMWPKGGGTKHFTAINGTRALLALGYNLYLVEHHYEQHDKPLLKRFLKRLRVPSQFFPTLAELNAAAKFLRAGFRLRYEDERQQGHHPEFVATDPISKKTFAVEVKCRAGADDPSLATHDRLGFRDEIYNALRKAIPHSRVVILDANIPDVVKADGEGWFPGAEADVNRAGAELTIGGAPLPPAYVFVVNHPYHFNPESTEGASCLAGLPISMPDFNPRHGRFGDFIRSRKAHAEMHAFMVAYQEHGDPPATFDGTAPELAFEPRGEEPLLIGNTYLFPDEDGQERPMVLEHAIMDVPGKKMVGTFRTADGKQVIGTVPVTDTEIRAYERHPTTFFGAVQRVSGNAETPLDLANFMYETYQHSTKEKLLEFMAGHPEIEHFKTLSQEELAILFVELNVQAFMNKHGDIQPAQAGEVGSPSTPSVVT